MLYAEAAQELAAPYAAGSIYGKIIRETENSRAFERRVFEKITAELEESSSPDAPFTARIAALHRNRELWIALTCDAASEGNQLPEAVRAKVISLGLWVFRETQNAIRGTTSIGNMIAINRIIMVGLGAEIQGVD